MVFSRQNISRLVLERERMVKMTNSRHTSDIYGGNEKRGVRLRSGAWRIFCNAVGIILYVAAGFFFCGAELPFGARVLGIAMVCGVSRGALGVALGICARAFTEYFYLDDKEMLILAVSCIAACAVRYAFSFAVRTADDAKKGIGTVTLCDSISARLVLSALIALGKGIALLIYGGSDFSGYELLSLFFAAAAAVIFTLLFSFAFERDYRFTSLYDTGTAALLFAIVLSLREIHIFGLSASLIVGFAATLYIGYFGQAARGCVTGLLIGIACTGIYIPLFAVAGLASGIFFSASVMAGIAVPVGVFTAGALLGGQYDISLFIFEILIGAAIIGIPAAMGALPDMCFFKNDGDRLSCRDLIAHKREAENKKRINGISETMGSLSDVLRELSDKLRVPERSMVEKMCRDIWKSHCSMCDGGCSPLELCGGDGTFFEKFTAKLMSGGKMSAERISDLAISGCTRLDYIMEDINACAAKMIGAALSNDKTGLFAFDYDMTARILADTAAYSEGICVPDRVLTEKLRRAFLASGIAPENVVVCGTRKKYIVACGGELSRASIGVEDIHKLCERICGVRLSAPEFIMERGETAMTLSSLPIFEVEYAGRQITKANEDYCGDCVSFAESDDGYSYCFICDGMGSGREAALTARICRIFLEKMLACGNKKSTTLEMLNMIIAGKGIECFATVDLLEIDLMLGTASFIKSGAAPSYVIRGESLFKIASSTAPIGIMPRLVAEMTEFELRDGDIIVLSSDGIAANDAPDGDGGMWLSELLESEDRSDLDAIAEKIAEAAKLHEKRSDDMTVELIRVKSIVKSTAVMRDEPVRTIA